MNARQEPPIAPFFGFIPSFVRRGRGGRRLYPTLPPLTKGRRIRRGESSAQHLSAGFQPQERRGHARHWKAQPAREFNRSNRTNGLHPAPHDRVDWLILLWELVIGC